MNPIQKRNIAKILWSAVIWAIAFLLWALIEKGVMGDTAFYPSTGNQFNFQRQLIFSPLFAALAGSLLGVIEVYWLSRMFKKRSFGQKLLLKNLFYLSSICILIVLGTAVSNAISLASSPFSEEVLLSVSSFVTDFAFLSLMIYISFVMLIILFVTEVSDNLGFGVLQNFLFGKYHHPKEENRVFMFLDLKSSTSIAEKLGHLRYFKFLSDYYRHITDPVILSYATIYQYVGDEIVVSWNPLEGKADNRCLWSFFRIRDTIEEHREYYMKEYGIIPTFKAGVHFGETTTGEIGKIKKEIIHTGDTLNTAARIQGLCNQYGVQTLISEDAVTALGSPSDFTFSLVGEVELRGRDKKIKVYNYNPKSE